VLDGGKPKGICKKGTDGDNDDRNCDYDRKVISNRSANDDKELYQ
jgi:hypothetical protein